MTRAPTAPLTTTPTVALGSPAPEAPDRTLTVDEILTPFDRSASLVNRVWPLRRDINVLHDEVIDTHAEMTLSRLDQRAQDLAAAGLSTLLEQLAEAGLAWVDIAALAGVSVPAVRKWRQGGAATGDKVLQLGQLVALLSWLRDEQVITDVVAWLEVPLVPEAPVTRLDLLKAGRRDLVIKSRVGEGTTPTEILDEFDPGWRARFESDFEVFVAADGQRSIRPKATS